MTTKWISVSSSGNLVVLRDSGLLSMMKQAISFNLASMAIESGVCIMQRCVTFDICHPKKAFKYRSRTHLIYRRQIFHDFTDDSSVTNPGSNMQRSLIHQVFLTEK
ncbi:hypothetical protein WN943_002074 [Citrus x changshan-huyou]